ncbi:phosphocholine cytidylyltransferase family protein [Halorubrum sp. FL23]|uniref:phosphocholine cytidylyltransferase family protein n=1 Tax=Halorubrum sp. FL23 TaxID=3458704 RepID=UPI004033BB8C
MKYIILAAGKGTRLRPKTADKPKPLVNVDDNRSILETHIHNADRSELISEICIVTGYKNERIRCDLENMSVSTDLSCVFNPYYDLAGPLGSVWSVNNQLSQTDFILCNGDTIFHSDIYELSNLNDNGVNLVVSEADSTSTDDLKIRCDSGGQFEHVGKDVSGSGLISAGMVSVVGEQARRQFTDSLYGLVSVQDHLVNEYWHSILNQIPRFSVNLLTVEKNNWVEIDNQQDLTKAADLFTNNWVRSNFD